MLDKILNLLLVLPGLLGDERLDHVRIRVHHHIALRQVFDILVPGRAGGFMADGLDNALGKFHRQGGFEADQRYASFTMLQPYFQSIRRMRIDQQAIFFVHFAYGVDPGRMAAGPGDHAEIVYFFP